MKHYKRIHTLSVAIIGVGGVGSVAAEMLVRCGIGKLVLYDCDCVEEANMNRLFYTPEHIGMDKVEAARHTLHAIDPSVDITSACLDITTLSAYKQLSNDITQSDLVLCCVDNYNARIAINRICCQQGQTWFEAGVSETAMGGHIQLMLPGRTACYECTPPMLIGEQLEENSIYRGLACTASLPTTMAMIASLLVQNALKLLLQFGRVSTCLNYNAFNDFFPSWDMKCNTACPNADCQYQQTVYPQWSTASLDFTATPEPTQHLQDTFGIEIASFSSQEKDETVESNLIQTDPADSIASLRSRLRDVQSHNAFPS